MPILVLFCDFFKPHAFFIIIFQLETLENVFRDQKYPDVYRREEMASELDLKEEVIRVSYIEQKYYSPEWCSSP